MIQLIKSEMFYIKGWYPSVFQTSKSCCHYMLFPEKHPYTLEDEFQQTVGLIKTKYHRPTTLQSP